jgi:hypothetical protein
MKPKVKMALIAQSKLGKARSKTPASGVAKEDGECQWVKATCQWREDC